MNDLKNKRPPDFFRPLLWSYDFNRINLEKNKKAIIINSINFGDLRHWRWLINTYGRDGVRDLLEKVSVSEIRPRVRRLASLIFLVNKFNYVPRGAK